MDCKAVKRELRTENRVAKNKIFSDDMVIWGESIEDVQIEWYQIV